MSEEEVKLRLRALILQSGSRKLFAKKNNLNQTYLSHVLLGRRKLGPKILKAIEVRKVIRYEVTP